MNKTSAKDWIIKAWHHFSSGKLLYEANHYTDSIGNDLQLDKVCSILEIDKSELI